MTAINGSTAVVTGGQRGLGKALAAQLLSRGATKVYATARRPHESVDVIPVGAGVTDSASVTAPAGRFGGAA
jgi:NAD(P)-dependent dehydrogenase (short-subunit alcohol dehydrogenase family)